MVLNGAKLAAVGAQYGAGGELVRQIVSRVIALSSREFREKHVWDHALGTEKQHVYRKHKCYLIPRIKAGVSPSPS